MSWEGWKSRLFRKTGLPQAVFNLAGKFVVSVRDRHKAEGDSDESFSLTTASVVAVRIAMSYKAIFVLWLRHCDDDAHIVLRTMVELRIQLLWLLSDEEKQEERSLRYYEWMRVEAARLWGLSIDLESPDPFVADASKFLDGIRTRYNLPPSIRDRKWEKWHAATIRQLAKEIGREDELYPLHDRLSGFVHASPYAIMRHMLSRESGAPFTLEEMAEQDGHYVIHEAMYTVCDVMQFVSEYLDLSIQRDVLRIVDRLRATQDVGGERDDRRD
jgi:hypothetical protein